MACKSRKNAEVSTSETPLKDGIVHVSKECGVVITITESGSELKLYPVNLSDEFKKEGLHISFSSLPSRAMQPTGCSVDRVVSVENVKKTK
jgi:hypothetical protein